MKQTLIAIGAMLALLMAGMMTGCDTRPGEMNYQLIITLDSKLHHDSATLLVLQDEYGQLLDCGSVAVKDNSCTFTGQVDRPRAALIRWDNDSTGQPFYFVLESGETRLTLAPDSWSATDSELNVEYLKFVNRRNAIMNARIATWQEYLKMAADSSLKRDDEQRMVRQDSLLNDSLQLITVEGINRNDAVGRIIRERYGHQLDQAHMRMLK